MITFDQILPNLTDLLTDQSVVLPEEYYPILINRDLNGRIRLILDAQHKEVWENLWTSNTSGHPLQQLAQSICDRLKPHTWSVEQLLLFEDDIEQFIESSVTFPLSDQKDDSIPGIHVVDRLATESTWSSISDPIKYIHRFVFYSIKGGVGRSTALAACALSMCSMGERVLVLDLDLESPGTSLLPEDRQPAFGITDWLVEDLVDNGDSIINNIQAQSPLPRQGRIFVVPAHGRTPGEYISKLGRVWMPSFLEDGSRQIWSKRLARLIDKLQERYRPDYVLIDSGSGINELASACLTDLGASRIYLFAQDNVQTWSGYRLLFEHWQQTGVASKIRERLKLVAAMQPAAMMSIEDGKFYDSAADFREKAYDIFRETLYDNGRRNRSSNFSFDLNDQKAPHYPCSIPWDQNFANVKSIHRLMAAMKKSKTSLHRQIVYGQLINQMTNDILNFYRHDSEVLSVQRR